jgi:hypothetical protein
MRKTRRPQSLDLESLRELLDLPGHELRALIANNHAGDDDSPYDFSDYTPRRIARPRQSAKEAR